MQLLQSVLQGVLLGFVIVMPGMSGGTALVILGIYGRLVGDLARLRLVPHLPLIFGLIFGVYLGGMAFARLLIFYRDITAAFFLGVILASLKVILQGRPFLRFDSMLALMAGLVIGYLMAGEPIGLVERTEVSPFLLFFGGAISSAAMLVPGIPGSAVLIVMGIYDDMLFFLNDLNLSSLLIFGIGGVAGIFLLARLLAKYYERYQHFLSFLFAGLIGGSVRILLPQVLDAGVVIALLAGLLLVWRWSGTGGAEVDQIIEPKR
jgi:putative membrane protein